MNENKDQTEYVDDAPTSEPTIHPSLHEPGRLEFLFGQRVVQYFLHPKATAATTVAEAEEAARRWLCRIVQEEPPESQRSLGELIGMLSWNTMEYELTCHNLQERLRKQQGVGIPERLNAVEVALEQLKGLKDLRDRWHREAEEAATAQQAARLERVPRPQRRNGSSPSASPKPECTSFVLDEAAITEIVTRSQKLSVTKTHLMKRLAVLPDAFRRRELLCCLAQRLGQRNELLNAEDICLTKTEIEALIQAAESQELIPLCEHLTTCIIVAFRNRQSMLCRELLTHLGYCRDAKLRLESLLDEGVGIPPAPSSKPKVHTSARPSSRTGLERFQAKWGPRSPEKTPKGSTIH